MPRPPLVAGPSPELNEQYSTKRQASTAATIRPRDTAMPEVLCLYSPPLFVPPRPHAGKLAWKSFFRTYALMEEVVDALMEADEVREAVGEGRSAQRLATSCVQLRGSFVRSGGRLHSRSRGESLQPVRTMDTPQESGVL